MEIDYRNYSVKQMDEIDDMAKKGWLHINMPMLVELTAVEEQKVVVTSKGPFIYYKYDTNV